MESIVDILNQIFEEAINSTFPDLPETPIAIANSPKFADYQCNSAMAISGLLKAQGFINIIHLNIYLGFLIY